jgi:hypothetical protein
VNGRGQGGGRAQLVLVAAVVIAVALAPVVLAYLQLGAHPDVDGEDGDYGEDARRFLERATHEAGADVARIDWTDRERAVEQVRTELDPRLDTLNTSRVEEGVAYAVSYDDSAASEWTREHCPRGDGRRFGSCRAIDGVVVLAVAYDVTVTTPRGERELTFVGRVVRARSRHGRTHVTSPVVSLEQLYVLQ